MARFNRVIEIPRELDTDRSLIRVNAKWIDKNKADKSKFFRKELVVVKNLENGRKIFREIAAASIPGLTMETVAMNYDNRDELIITGREAEVYLQIRRANLVDRIIFIFFHPERADAIMNRWGLFLGIIGFKEELISAVKWLVNHL